MTLDELYKLIENSTGIWDSGIGFLIMVFTGIQTFLVFMAYTFGKKYLDQHKEKIRFEKDHESARLLVINVIKLKKKFDNCLNIKSPKTLEYEGNDPSYEKYRYYIREFHKRYSDVRYPDSQFVIESRALTILIGNEKLKASLEEFEKTISRIGKAYKKAGFYIRLYDAHDYKDPVDPQKLAKWSTSIPMGLNDKKNKLLKKYITAYENLLRECNSILE